MSLSDRLLAGDRRALARLLTHVENDDDIGRAGVARLYPSTGRAHIIGVTGPPGAGKSTLVNALIQEFRQFCRRVGVLAVDPSSSLSGGAALGDRIRMTGWHDDPDVFIRSMAARGHPGGLARESFAIAHVLDAAGFDPILIETVGVGQDEVAIAGSAHTTVLVQVPGLGDSVQALKAGVLEVGDLLVVNKSDRPGAAELARDLTQMLAWGMDNRHSFTRPAPHTPHADSHSPCPMPHAPSWRVPVLRTCAERHEGIPELREQIEAHRDYLGESSQLAVRERAMASAELLALLHAEFTRRLRAESSEGEPFRRAVEDVAARRRSPAEAVASLLDAPPALQ